MCIAKEFLRHLNERESSPLHISTLHSAVSYRSHFLKPLYLLSSLWILSNGVLPCSDPADAK